MTQVFSKHVFPQHPFSKHPRAILLSGYALLVFALLGVTPLWLDELLQLNLAWERSFTELLPWMEIQPGAVPLPYVVQQLALRLLGHSAFAARFCAALFSVLAGVAFVAVCDRISLRRRVLALALFLFVPLQFRYALEARGYSQGLFFTVATMWVFLEWLKAPSWRLAALYFATVAIGLYFHPFLAFPVAAQLLAAPLRTRPNRQIWIAAALGAASFLPWLLLQHYARQSYISPELYPVGHLTPLVVIHELTGGGYLPALCLLALAGFGSVPGEMNAAAHRLLLWSATLTIAGPLTADAVFHYFFASRQFLIAMPALVLLAAHGFERLWKRQALLAVAPVSVLLAVSFVKDAQDAIVPKDDLAASAQAVAPFMSGDSCVLAAPSWERDYFNFFRSDVRFAPCADPPASSRVLVVLSPTGTPAERKAALSRVAGRYQREAVLPVGKSELGVYRQTGGN